MVGSPGEQNTEIGCFIFIVQARRRKRRRDGEEIPCRMTLTFGTRPPLPPPSLPPANLPFALWQFVTHAYTLCNFEMGVLTLSRVRPYHVSFRPRPRVIETLEGRLIERGTLNDPRPEFRGYVLLILPRKRELGMPCSCGRPTNDVGRGPKNLYVMHVYVYICVRLIRSFS